MTQSLWNDLLLDTAAVPVRLSDARFEPWMGAQRVFVSSAMDAEMNPYRDVVRAYLQKFGPDVAIMWETLSPQDLGPKRAFLSGVDRSSLFLMMLGARYGVPDESGYSPTHQEANRAKERHLHRLVFTLPVANAARDGKLNDWIRELHVDVSGNAASSPKAVIESLDARLRDFAARSERLWIKLGVCIFPGRVESQADRQGARTFIVHAQAYDGRVRQALLGINDPSSRRGGEMRLTWPNESYPVTVESVKLNQQFVGEAEVEILCRTPQNWYGNASSGIAAFSSVNGVGADELTRRWADEAFFGNVAIEDQRSFGLGRFSRPDGPTLPQVMSASGASGWQAEGVAALYLIEESARTRGGHFSNLRVGPATSTGVPVAGVLIIDLQGQRYSTMNVQGVIPISR